MTPIRDAYVLVEPGDVQRQVAGVPHLLRTLLTLQQAGVERCVLVGDVCPPRDPRLRLGMVVDRHPAPGPDDRPTLVIGPGAVVDRRLLAWMAAEARPDRVLDLGRAGAQVRVAPARRALPFGPPPSRTTAPVGTLGSAADPGVVGELLRALDNARDGYLDRLLHRRLSRPISQRLLGRGVSPNAVTLAAMVIGVAGGMLLALPGAVAVGAAVVLLLASSVLDCVDGEIARLGFAESRLGHVLDVLGDTVVHVAVLAGIAGRLAGSGALPSRGTLVLLALGVLGSFAAITWSEVSETRRHRVPCWENRVLDGVLSPLTTRDWYAFPVLFAALGALDALVPAAAVGAHGFWLLVAVLVQRVLRRAPPPTARA